MNHLLPKLQRHRLDWVRVATSLSRFCVLGCLVGALTVGRELPAQSPDIEPSSVEAVETPDMAPVASTDPEVPAQKPQTKISTNIIDMIDALGFWVVPFALASIILLWFTVDRMVVLRRGRVIPKPFVQRFLRLLEDGELEQDEALEICQLNQSPIANIFAHAVRKWGKPSVDASSVTFSNNG